MGSKAFSVTLDGSGAVTASIIMMPTQGILTSIRLSKNGQSNNPSVTIEKHPSGEDVVTGLTVNADASIYPTTLKEAPDGTDSTERAYFNLGGQALAMTVTGGSSAGVVSGIIEWI